MTLSIRSFVATAALVLTSFVSVAHAQSSKMTVDVPFAFEYAGHAYAAGQYSFTANGNVVELNRGDQIQGSIAHRVSMDPAKTAKVVFDRTGGQYYLRQIDLGGKNQSFTFLESKQEKQARTVNVAGNAVSSAADVAVVAAQ